ncbi:alpha/beta hydrolase [Plasmodium brasilianum]|uniref:Alpha/beta hydrolase, putative n=2 Tax=Plasmodium (Plasmodium) TaxID=418103 RepID=A0A1A8WF47_PLAMA|nr:alpha/beta hydrolase, putative [Plasmodium malariae]KAI4838542.1 alpha/beta hydrolase [Plasmodium brasilianum]SBS91585.1 alpha/beta hydrolase, putative [Plasmodium malariae]SCN12945.1 alpha/beta hydrolase, putative [Plasmodium malariae]
MRKLFFNLNKSVKVVNSNLYDELSSINKVQKEKLEKRACSAFSNNNTARGNKLFCSFAISRDGKEIDHTVEGISFTIHDNSSIYKEGTSHVPIVLIHGCYGSKKNFFFFSKMLKSNKIISLDLRNHGNSKHTDTMKYEDMEIDILNILQRLKIRKCCLVGFSLGGKLSMYCALKNSTLFSHLVIMDILPFNYNNSNNIIQVKLPYNVTQMTTILYDIKMNKKPKNKNEFLYYLKEMVPTISDTFAQFLCMSLSDNKDKNKLTWKINVQTIYNELSHLMSFPLCSDKYTYTNPCSFIIGKKSDLAFTIPQYDHIINSFFPSSQHFILEHSSHTVYIDEAQQCADIINNTLCL